MHYQGDQLISRATYFSNRSVLAICIAKIFLVHFEVDVENLQVANIQPGADAVLAATDFLIVFLFISHILSWLSDLNSFQSLNSAKKVTGGALWGRGGTEFRSKVDDTLVRLEDAADAATELRKTPSAEKAASFENQISRCVELLEALQASTDRLALHAKLYFFVWFVALPCLASVYAVFWI